MGDMERKWRGEIIKEERERKKSKGKRKRLMLGGWRKLERKKMEGGRYLWDKKEEENE